jgi:hypothetical protein
MLALFRQLRLHQLYNLLPPVLNHHLHLLMQSLSQVLLVALSLTLLLLMMQLGLLNLLV